MLASELMQRLVSAVSFQVGITVMTLGWNIFSGSLASVTVMEASCVETDYSQMTHWNQVEFVF